MKDDARNGHDTDQLVGSILRPVMITVENSTAKPKGPPESGSASLINQPEAQSKDTTDLDSVLSRLWWLDAAGSKVARSRCVSVLKRPTAGEAFTHLC